MNLAASTTISGGWRRLKRIPSVVACRVTRLVIENWIHGRSKPLKFYHESQLKEPTIHGLFPGLASHWLFKSLRVSRCGYGVWIAGPLQNWGKSQLQFWYYIRVYLEFTIKYPDLFLERRTTSYISSWKIDHLVSTNNRHETSTGSLPMPRFLASSVPRKRATPRLITGSKSSNVLSLICILLLEFSSFKFESFTIARL